MHCKLSTRNQMQITCIKLLIDLLNHAKQRKNPASTVLKQEGNPLCQMFITKATYFIHVIHSNLPKRGHSKYKDGDTACLTA